MLTAIAPLYRFAKCIGPPVLDGPFAEHFAGGQNRCERRGQRNVGRVSSPPIYTTTVRGRRDDDHSAYFFGMCCYQHFINTAVLLILSLLP